MIDFLFLDPNSPYLFALGLLIVLGLFEGLALLVGLSFAGLLDDLSPFSVDSSDLDSGGLSTGGASSIIGWLCLDKVPLLIWLVILLTAFSILGYTFNYTSVSLISATLPAYIGPAITFAISLYLTAKIGAKISSVVPQVESSALSEDAFVGQKAIILSSVIRQGSAGEASFVDEHQQKHYVMVEPLESDQEFTNGQAVVLVEKAINSWKAIPYQAVI